MVRATDADDRSLQDVEDDDWGEPDADATTLLRRVLDLRRRRLGTLGVEDLRIMIGQSVGLPVLVPRALAVLDDDPLAEGDYYPGDLLSAVLTRFDEWADDVPDARQVVAAIVAQVDVDEPDLPPNVADLVRGFREAEPRESH